MQKYLVSVLTPVYNGESYLSRLLDSVLNQTYPHVEMILVNDGSSDATVEIANSYIPKFKSRGYPYTVISVPHKNASAAINAGLPCVNGQYLVWPDSDDELLPGSIEVRVNFLKTHPEYHCVRSIMEYVSHETGAPIERGESLGDLSKEDIFWDILEDRSFVCCGCYMLETERFFQIYPDKKIMESYFGQNYQMLLPYLFKYRCPTIRQRLYRVYVRPDSHFRRVKTEAEERFYLASFDRLVDETRHICSLNDAASLLRIKLRKVRYREWVAGRSRHRIRRLGYKMAVKWLRASLFLVQAMKK